MPLRFSQCGVFHCQKTGFVHLSLVDAWFLPALHESKHTRGVSTGGIHSDKVVHVSEQLLRMLFIDFGSEVLDMVIHGSKVEGGL